MTFPLGMPCLKYFSGPKPSLIAFFHLAPNSINNYFLLHVQQPLLNIKELKSLNEVVEVYMTQKASNLHLELDAKEYNSVVSYFNQSINKSTILLM